MLGGKLYFASLPDDTPDTWPVGFNSREFLDALEVLARQSGAEIDQRRKPEPQAARETSVLEQARTPDRHLKALHHDAGRWLKELRMARGLSQRELAEKVGVDYYTFIAQLESGLGRIEPDHYCIWADALGMAPLKFVLKLMRYYEPGTYRTPRQSGSTRRQ